VSPRALLAVLGDPEPFAPLVEWIRRRGLAVQIATTAQDGLRLHREGSASLVLVGLPLADTQADELLAALRQHDPATTIVVCGEDAQVATARRAIELGADEYVAEPIERQRDLFYALGVLLGLRDGDIQLRALRERELAAVGWTSIVGACPAMQPAMTKLRDLCDRTLSGAAPRVLLVGELGTGKRLFARCLHHQGARRGRPFLETGCAQTSADALRELLFGRERALHRGFFELAAGGTLFLDEIAGVPLDVQQELLRAIEDRLIVRIGGSAPIEVDVQVIAATRRDLGSMAQRGELRADLYHRLCVLSIELPPLRERGDDIIAIAELMLAAIAGERGLPVPRLADEARQLLLERSWPGNLRELHLEMERLVLLVDHDVIGPDDLRARDRGVIEIDGSDRKLSVTISGEHCPLEEIEREVIRQALIKCGGNVSRAARFLAVTRQTMLYRMKKHGFATPSRPGPIEPETT